MENRTIAIASIIIGVCVAGLGITAVSSFLTTQVVGIPTDFPLSASAVGTNSLNLTLSLNASSISQGQSIGVTIDESNLLNTASTVNSSSNWPLFLSLGPCGHGNYPIGLAIFDGYYTSSNISAADSLELYQPGVRACPMFMLLITSYTFQPLSDIASVNSPNPGFNLSMNSDLTANGYWSGTSAENFVVFPPGIYTIVGGDEWGQLVILHFDVT
jgi:hypothetical protein